MQGFIVLSCLIAVFVNFSTFLVIGKTSPVTYQVLGHLKTCLVLAFGYTLLHDPFTSRNIIGILIAIVGMGLYSYFCTNDAKKKQIVDVSSMPPQVHTPLILLQYNVAMFVQDICLTKLLFFFFFRLKREIIVHFWQIIKIKNPRILWFDLQTCLF